jgi:ribosome-associated heat shock protein Hsp15
MEKVRIDKWLWSVRIFKSRTLATDACKGGKVKIAGEGVKPSYLVTVGEKVAVKKDGFTFEYKVAALIEKRVGAPIAVTCYEDVTPEEERNKYNAWFTNALKTTEVRERGAGRPTKKERREIDGFKDGPDFEDDDE